MLANTNNLLTILHELLSYSSKEMQKYAIPYTQPVKKHNGHVMHTSLGGVVIKYQGFLSVKKY